MKKTFLKRAAAFLVCLTALMSCIIIPISAEELPDPTTIEKITNFFNIAPFLNNPEMINHNHNGASYTFNSSTQELTFTNLSLTINWHEGIETKYYVEFPNLKVKDILPYCVPNATYMLAYFNEDQKAYIAFGDTVITPFETFTVTEEMLESNFCISMLWDEFMGNVKFNNIVVTTDLSIDRMQLEYCYQPFVEYNNILNARQNGYQEGIIEGSESGYQNGYQNGITEGSENGYKNGYQNGYNDGKIIGKTEGHTEGYNEGLLDRITGQKDVLKNATYILSLEGPNIYEEIELTSMFIGNNGRISFESAEHELTEIYNRIPNVNKLIDEGKINNVKITISLPLEDAYYYSNWPLFTKATGCYKINIITTNNVTYEGKKQSTASNAAKITIPNLNDPIKVQKFEMYFHNLSDFQDAEIFTENDTYNNGYNDGYYWGEKIKTENAYNQGKEEGIILGKQEGLKLSEKGNWRELMNAIVEAPVNTFRSLFNFEILGLDMRAAFGSILAVCMLLIIVKKVLL